MKIVTSETMTHVDHRAQEEFFIPGLVLMEQAGIAVLDVLEEQMKELNPLVSERQVKVDTVLDKEVSRITVIAGPGNNGGDALVTARAAVVRGYRNISIILIRDKTNEIMQRQKKICETLGIPLHVWGSPASLLVLDESDFLIDGISGTGLSGDIRGPALEATQYILQLRQKKLFIISIDLPSGMYDRGGDGTVALEADFTVTMGLPKSVLFYPHNRVKCGKIVCRNPGFPPALLEQAEAEAHLIPLDTIQLPEMPKNNYKNTKGHVGVFAGSSGMTGAAVLASNAALRMRAGLVSLFADPDVYPAAAGRTASLLVKPIAFQEIVPAKELSEKFSTLLAGPGWGTGDRQILQLREILESGLPAVIDADGITLFSQLSKEKGFVNHNGRCVFTPHPGEFLRLTGVSTKEHPEKIFSAVREYAVKNHCTLVYKSHITYIASAKGEFAVIDGMNPAMGTAGSGDVLAGVISGLLAQGTDEFEAARLGAAFHQKAGKTAYNDIGIFTSEDLLTIISSLAR